jgi:glycine hydroxymethyltransferase
LPNKFKFGTRAAEGHIGRVNRWFAGTQYIDEVESLCVELLKRAFRCNYADHRLMGSMLGNMTVFHAMTRPGDTIMAAPQPYGGHFGNRFRSSTTILTMAGRPAWQQHSVRGRVIWKN